MITPRICKDVGSCARVPATSLSDSIGRAEWNMARLIAFIVSGVLLVPIASAAQAPPVTLRADVVIDGTGNTLRNTNIVVQGTKIQSIGQTTAQGPAYDLRGLT